MDVHIEGLRFTRGRRVVLDIPSLTLHGSRTTAILGPNGAGKTTLLRLIAGLESPTEGRIRRIRPSEPADAARSGGVAYVFQENVFLRQSVRENLELGLRLQRLPQPERIHRIDAAARLLGIEHLLERRADTLSGGEGRRASLARALCLQAPLVLLDEPLAGLDPPTYSRLRAELPRLLDAFGATTILVTHDRDEALRLGEDLVVLLHGCVHAAGSKRDVVLHPTDAAAAEILGYTVLDFENRRFAVRTDALRLGPGPVQFVLDVDGLIDLADRCEIVGRVGGTRMHVTATPPNLPKPGTRVVVHAERACSLPR
jgi:ABC-type sugar transport system ATPase subunit